MTNKFALFAVLSILCTAHKCFSQGVPFDSLKANAGSNKALIYTPVANYGHKIYGFDAGSRTDLRFAARANTPIWTDIMSITSVGNVGIGELNPSEKLTLNGNLLIQPANYFGVSLADRFTYDSKSQPHYGMQWVADTWTASGYTWWVSSFGGMKFFTAGAPRMVINDAGNVSIGNTVPVNKLTIWGANPNEAAIAIQSGSDTRFTIMEGGNALKIGPNSTGAISVLNTGNVGIGTVTTGGNKLAVEGTLSARKVKVTQEVWADFVFDAAYRLPSLSEVENYINRNKHLPDVPAAAEITKNGQDLGEMNRILLKKVEELTLYMIEQNKQLEALKKEVNTLKQ